MTICYIGLGSNLNEPASQLRAAYASLCTLSVSELLHASSIYLTSPEGMISQPDYLNAAVAIETQLSAPSLLAALQKIENKQGRVRKERWGARVIDLDLLLFGDSELSLPNLIVPHPRLHKRMFVLTPLLEICEEEKRLPSGASLGEILADCPPSRVEKTSLCLF